jgi:hypothetical protein
MGRRYRPPGSPGPLCRLGCSQFERGEAAVRLLTNFMIPTTTITAPTWTRTNAVNQTAKPMPIANTPLASQGQAPFTSEGYSRSTGCHLGRWAGGIAPRPDLEPSPPRRSAARSEPRVGSA